ncbi:MAG: hypothetical protein J5781_02905, partial [Clostridia bacterium]|nr:hypothetical protein [Clostridia bacterium]
LNKENYFDLSAMNTGSVTYSIAPKSETQFIVYNRENYLAAGNYTGSITYSYFADVNKTNKFSTDYIYLGNSSVLLDNDIATVLNYALFGIVSDGALVFNNTFDYTVEQKPVSVYIENKDTQYNFSNQTLVVRIDGSLASGDRLNFLFDLAIVYNSKTDVVENNATTIKSFAYYSVVPDEMLTIDNMSSFYEYGSMGFVLTQDTIPMSRKSYYIYTNASDLSNESYDIAYSGTYTVTLNDLGNNNYRLATGEAVEKTFTVVPNEIPILLYNKASTPQISTTDFTFEEIYAKKAYTPIDSTWTATTFANSLLFDSVTINGLSSVNSSSTRVVGSATIGSNSYDVYIKFHSSFSTLSVTGNEIKTPAPNSRTLLMDTYSSENDYYFCFIDGSSAERKIYFDTDTNTYYYKDAAYTTYKTTTCTIVDRYYDEEGVLHCPQALVNTPNTLYIYSEDAPGSGNRPVYVKRDPDTKAVLGYDIVSRDTSAYVNYSVVFVYLDNGVYRECDDAHRFSFVINPAEVSLYNFSSANSKDYDGSAATITNTSKLTVNGALSTDPISVSDIVFEFERLDEEGSTYITIGGERYYLISEADMSSAGVFKVSAYYSDNYNIVFKGNGSYLTSPSEYGVYTIKRVKATFEFNSESVSYLSKQYDGQGLTESETSVCSGKLTDFVDCGFNVISKQSKTILDSYAGIYYQLAVKGYSTTFNGTPTAISQNQVAGYDYSAGYYWFDFYGIFVDKNGNYRRYDDRSDYDEGVRWLNWNYSFIVNNKKDVNKIEDVYHDGIYRIDKRNAYIGINGQLPDNAASASYTYLHEYNGVTLTRADVNGWLQSGVVTVYIYDETARKFVPIADTYFADAFNGGYLTVSGGKESVTNVGSTEFFELSSSGITSNNANFVIINSDIRFALKPLEIEIMLTYTNADYNNATAVTYGRTARENAVNFTLSISEEALERFNNAINDGNTYTASEVLEAVSYFNNAEFYLYSETNSSAAVFKFLLEGKSRYLFTYDMAGDYFTQVTNGGDQDGVTYYNRLLVPNSVALDYTKYYSYHEQYELTSDAMSVAGKKYYLVELVTENDPEFRAGNGIPENSYYERAYGYSFTADVVFRSGVSYYLRDPGANTYSLADTSALIGAAVPAETYYTQKAYYVLTTDRIFNLQKRYYTFTEYSFTEQNATATANTYYELNKFYSECEDDYFLSGYDYYVFTVVPAANSKVGTNVKAETYYEWIDGRFALTSDLTFVRTRLFGGNYYTVEKADVITGDNAHKKYYVQNAGRWERVPDGTARASGVSYYVFIPTVYSQTQTVTEYYYYYADGRFYNVNEMSRVISADGNYYVAYIADKSANENVSYYTEYEAIVKAEGTIENGAYYYKAVLMDHTEDVGTYYAAKRLLPGRDYYYDAQMPAGRNIYENVDGSDTYYLTTDTTFVIDKNYYELVLVS